MLDFERLLRTPYLDASNGYDISPDGRQVAFAWNRTGQWEIYLLELGLSVEPRQLTGGPGAKFGPRFSKNGRFLLYACDLDGGEAFDVWLCDLASGEQVNLTPETSYAIQPTLSWSPDGRQAALISDQSGRFSAYVLDLELQDGVRAVGPPRLVFDGPGPYFNLAWSPGGDWLAIVSESRGQDFAVSLAPVGENISGGDMRCPFILDIEGELLNARDIRWSPDGKWLAFASDLPGSYQIGMIAPPEKRLVWLTSGAGDRSELDWSPDGERLACVLSDGPDTWLELRSLNGGDAKRYQVEPGVHFAPRFTPDGTKILCIFDSPRRPDDLWQFDLAQETFQPLTCSLPADLSPEDFVMPRHVRYPSLDGQQVPALLYLPEVLSELSPAKKELHPAKSVLPPAVIVIHGGPNWLFQFLWYPFMAHLASRGWVVLAPNYRGSTGYGRAWQLSNRFEMGRGDTMDVAAGVDYLIDQGLADPKRIAVTGRSHGGYLTMSCLTSYPERWVAGSAVVPFLNWFTAHENSRPDLQHWDRENMGDPVENAACWRERSPYFYLERVRAPVQLICGANDPRCPASESAAARDALLELGKAVDFLLYPDEGHTFLKIENVVDQELRRAAFLSEALEAKGEGEWNECIST